MWIIWQETKGIIADAWHETTDAAHIVYVTWLDVRPMVPAALTITWGYLASVFLITFPLWAVFDDIGHYISIHIPQLGFGTDRERLILPPLLGILMFVCGVLLLFFTAALKERVEKRLEGKPKETGEQTSSPTNEDPLVPMWIESQQESNKAE